MLACGWLSVIAIADCRPRWQKALVKMEQIIAFLFWAPFSGVASESNVKMLFRGTWGVRTPTLENSMFGDTAVSFGHFAWHAETRSVVFLCFSLCFGLHFRNHLLIVHSVCYFFFSFFTFSSSYVSHIISLVLPLSFHAANYSRAGVREEQQPEE